MEHHDEIERISQVYETQYKPDPKDRRYPWNARNPISLYYRQALEKIVVKLFNDMDIDLEPLKVLDVGCGTGGFLRYLTSIGATPEFLHGVDLMEYRIEQARKLSPPTIDFYHGDAQKLAYPDFSFDMVSQLTVFSSFHEEGLREKIAREMDRVLRPGGILLWYDLRTGHSATARGIELDAIVSFFPNYSMQRCSRIHPKWASSLALRSILLAEIAGNLPLLIKTHLLCFMKKPEG